VHRRGFQPAVSRLEDRTLLATVTWTNPSGGDWDTPSNWSTDSVPGPSDDAVIDTSGITVTHSGPAADAVNSLTSQASLSFSDGSLAVASSSSVTSGLTISGGILSTAGTLTVIGSMDWTGGTIAGGGTLAAQGGLTLGGPYDGGNETLIGATIENAAAATLSSGGEPWPYANYGLVLESGAVFDNQSTGTFTLLPNASIFGDSTSDLINEGSLTVSPEVTNVLIQPLLTQTSTGTTAVEGGHVYSRGGGTISGSVTVAAGTALELDGPSAYEFDSASSVTGAGFVAVGDTVMTEDGTYDVGGETQVTGPGTLIFNSDATITNLGTVSIYSSTSTLTIDSSQSFSFTTMMIDGTLNGGGGDLTVTGSMTLDGGTISGFGTMTIPSQATLNLGDTNGGAPTQNLVGLTLDNFGTTVWENSGYYSDLDGVDGATFNNEPGATLVAQGGGCNLDGVTLNNYGTVTWSTGAFGVDAGTVFNNKPGATLNSQCDGGAGSGGILNNLAGATIVVNNDGQAGMGMGEIVNNDGVIDLDSGSLDLGGTFSGTGGTAISNGKFCAAPGTTLNFSFPENFTPTSSINADTVGFNSYYNPGAFNVAGNYAACQETSLIDTTVNFTGTVTRVGSSALILAFPNATANFSPSTPTTLTTTECTIGAGCTLTGTDSFVVTGSLTWAGTLSTTGTVDAMGGISITGIGTLESTLNNYGTGTLSSENLLYFFIDNGGKFNNEPSGTFEMEGPAVGVSYQGSAGAFNNAGTLVANPGATGEAFFYGPLTNTGTVDVQSGLLAAVYFPVVNSGTLTVESAATFSPLSYTQSAGATILNGGTFGGGPITIVGGSLSGSGTIDTSVTSSGQIIPGGTAAGLLTINGNYTQTASGSLDIDLGGTTADSQYDQLAISGTATLGGQLDISVINSFQPTLGNTFQVLTFASSSGNFGFYNGIVLGNRLILNPALNPSNLTLTVQPAVTTTTLSAPPSPSVSGQSVAFTAAVTVALPPTTIDPRPTGTVTFYDNGISIGTGSLGVVNGQEQATLTTAMLSTASHPITATYTSGDANFVPSSVSTAVTQVVNKANTGTAIATSGNPAVYGQAVTFTATVSVVSPGSTAVANPGGTVTFYDTGTSIGSATLSVVSGDDQATFTTSSMSTATHPITAAYTSGDVNFNASTSSTSISQVVNQDSTTTTVSASPSFANVGQSVTFTATVTANAPGSGTPTGTVDFYDTTTSTDLTPVHVALASGTAAFSTTSLAAGSHTIKASYYGDTNFLSSFGSTGTVTIGQSIIVLDPSAGGALSLSGNASIKLTGGVYVDSSSSTALSASGNAAIKASVIDVAGKVQKSGNASFSPAPVTGAPVVADPLSGLAAPTGGTVRTAVNLSGNSSLTINPGIYSSISASGNASLTLSTGIYIIEGGGLLVSGNASISGSGVMIVNAGSAYPSKGGTYGSITLSGNGSYNLSPPTTGTYAGIVIFQTRDNTKALTVSGNASGMTGTIYAPAAQLSESGNAQLNAALIVDMLTVSGNGIANGLTLSAPTGTVAFTPAQIRAAYGVSSLALDGTGQTIAIVDAYDDPSIYPALDAFDSQFGLSSSGPSLYSQYGPAASFLTVLNQYGQATSLPGTDPNGPGTDNWEVEEALDVEWVHAIAPGAQIILVEANSQALSDLMASVATAASQPGVSVVSMSWGFAEGQAVFASDEATYDSTFNVPGVTFVASTGDYGAADPEYPAFSPNVVAVGGTSLTLNVDNSYNSETGWGYYSDSAGASIGSGGGISLYEPEPAYQQGVQSTGYRTTPDVSLVADPATGAWIADTYNLDPSNPFEIVGGTSLSSPAWAGLLALVNQGRAAAGESTLNSSTPTDSQQALYMLPQSDYNAIASGNNGYSAGAGYNLVTGLGTPVANLLVPDLIAYQGPGTTYSGPTVGPLQNATLTNTGTNSSSPIDVFSVFDSLTIASNGLGSVQGPGHDTDPNSVLNATLAPAAANQTPTTGFFSQSGHALGLSAGANLSPGGLMPLPPNGVTLIPVSTGLMSQPVVHTPTSSEHFVELQRTDRDDELGLILTRLRTGLPPDSVLDELASDVVLVRVRKASETVGALGIPSSGVIDPEAGPGPGAILFVESGLAPDSTGPMPRQDPPRQGAARKAWLTDILFAAGFCSFGAGLLAARNRRAGSPHQKRKPLEIKLIPGR